MTDDASMQAPLDTASRVKRGVRRYLHALGLVSLTEFTLRTGRRADVLALGGDGTIVIVEVKSSVADFRSDKKWPEYQSFCNRFYFAVAEDFPHERIPDACGLLVADAFGAAMIRESPPMDLAPARRKALLMAFAQNAAERLHRFEDPGLMVQNWTGRAL
jgi:hypothetical protein